MKRALAFSLAVVFSSTLFNQEAMAAQKRSAAAIYQFKKNNPCPSTRLNRGPCPGHIIDHIIALKRGGPDRPCNMQWQTVADAKAKDRWE